MSLSRLKSRSGLLLAATVSLCSISAASQGSVRNASDALPHILVKPAASMEVAMAPYGPYPYGPYPYGCATTVPTLKSMQNYMWQSHQWRGDFPVCQPLSEPNFGHFGTRWRLFPGTEYSGPRPPMTAATTAPAYAPATPPPAPAARSAPAAAPAPAAAAGPTTPAPPTPPEPALEK